MRTRPKSRIFRRLLREESGQALVEFAFVMLMMLALTMGLIDFGRLFLRKQVMQDAVREAARRAVVVGGGTETEIYNALLAQLEVAGITTTGAPAPAENCGSPPTPVTVVTVYKCLWNGAANTQAIVGVSVPFEFALVGPLIGWATGDRRITLRSRFIMRNE